MSIGIEAIEIYFPKTFVDQKDLCKIFLTKKNTVESQKENILKVSDSSSSPSPTPKKTSIPSLSQVTSRLFSRPQIDEEKWNPSIQSWKTGSRH